MIMNTCDSVDEWFILTDYFIASILFVILLLTSIFCIKGIYQQWQADDIGKQFMILIVVTSIIFSLNGITLIFSNTLADESYCSLPNHYSYNSFILQLGCIICSQSLLHLISGTRLIYIFADSFFAFPSKVWSYIVIISTIPAIIWFIMWITTFFLHLIKDNVTINVILWIAVSIAGVSLLTYFINCIWIILAFRVRLNNFRTYGSSTRQTPSTFNRSNWNSKKNNNNNNNDNNNDVGSNSNKDNYKMNKKNKRKTKKETKTNIRAVDKANEIASKVAVCVFFNLLSTLITIVATVTLYNLYPDEENGYDYVGWGLRKFVLIDCSIKVLCLRMQYSFSKKLYFRLCTCCHRYVTRWNIVP